jgi:hypothetical protein
MRFASRIILAAIFALAGWVSWSYGQLQQRIADADQDVSTLRLETGAAEYDDAESDLGLFQRVPWVSERVSQGIQNGRSAAGYWLRDYAPLAATRPTLDSSPHEADVLLTAANAQYRTSRSSPGDRQAAVQRLEGVLARYSDVLKRGPEHVDAAYNYEYVARLRDRLVKNPRGNVDSAPAADDSGQTPQDLPSGPTLHGTPGAPPPGTDMKQFRLIVPMQPEERKSNPFESGEPQKKNRRG